MDEQTTGATGQTAAPDDKKEGLDFPSWLATHRRARLADELSEEMRELVAAVEETGKKGMLTLTIGVSPMKGMDGAVQVTDSVKASRPKLDRPSMPYFSDGQGGLSDSPKDQQAFDFGATGGGR